MNTLNVVHVALTPLAGSPVRIVNAFNRYTIGRARLIVLHPNAYGDRRFEGDIEWSCDAEEALMLLHEADIVHLHHYFELENNPFGINFKQVSPRACFLRQFHTHPLTIACGDEGLAKRIVNSDLPQLVIAQYHERFYPRARIVPNIVPLMNQLYLPIARNGDDPVLFFAPTFGHSAWEVPENNTRWETKGAPETEELLQKVVRACGKGQVLVRRNIPHEQCLQEKQASDIAIDELITGSYHLSSLESLSQGLPTFAYLDARTLDTVYELTGTHIQPWLNFRLEEAPRPLCELIDDAKLRQEMGAYSREWMETYYSDQQMVAHYVHAYEDLLERPEKFNRLRFDPTNRRAFWLAQCRDDLVWESRNQASVDQPVSQEREPIKLFLTETSKPSRVRGWIKQRAHALIKRFTSVRMDEIESLQGHLTDLEKTLDFVHANEINRWLYANRLERMDATVSLFDAKRREFHLDRYRFAAKRVKGKYALDCACGTGYGVRLLHEEGKAANVIGVDIDEKAIEYAQKKHRAVNTYFVRATANQLPIADGSADVITSFETIEHLPDDAALIKEFHRVLRADGILIISTPNQWPLATTPFHVREYNRRSFIAVLEGRFDCIEIYNQNSGSETPYNHGQPRGIVATSTSNQDLAECYIAICQPV